MGAFFNLAGLWPVSPMGVFMLVIPLAFVAGFIAGWLFWLFQSEDF